MNSVEPSGRARINAASSGGIVVPGDLKAREVIRGAATVLRQARARSGRARRRRPRLTARLVHETPRWSQRKIEGPAHPGNRELLRNARHRVQHRWQQMRVFVRVQMRRLRGRRRGSCAPARTTRRKLEFAEKRPLASVVRRSRERRAAPTSTRWQPTSSEGFSLARRTASSNAAPVAISVVAVRMPSRCASTIP